MSAAEWVDSLPPELRFTAYEWGWNLLTTEELIALISALG